MMLTEEQLIEMTGFERRSSIEKCLRAQGIPVYSGKHGRLFVLLNSAENIAINQNKPKYVIDNGTIKN